MVTTAMGRGRKASSRPKSRPATPAEERASRATAAGPAWRRWAAAAAVVALAAAAMGPGLGGELLNWDDDRFVRDDDLIRGFDLANVGRIFAAPHFEAYHPLHLLSYMLDYELWGLWAPGYKLLNFALYGLCLGLLFVLCRRLGLSPLGAWVATLLFAVHPLHVEAVVWVTARKEPLSLALMLGAALAHLRSERLRDRWSIAAIVLFALALITKTSTVVLPALLLAADLLVRRRPWRRALVAVAPMAAVAVGVGLYVVSLWQENEMARPMPRNGVAGLVALWGKTYWHYLAKSVVPARLSPVYPIDRAGAFDLAAVAGFVAWAAGLALALRSRDRLLGLGAVWAAIALVPVSNLVPVYFFVQDRYALIATAGLALVAGRLFERLGGAELRGRSLRWAAIAAALVIASALAAGAATQAAAWRTSLSLWRRATAAQPGAYYGFLALGHTLRDQGDLDGAIAAYRRAIAIDPSLPQGGLSLCLADARRNAARQGRPAEEVDRVGSVLRQRWGSAPGLLDLSARLMVQGYGGCAQLAESRAFELRVPTARDLVMAASRWAMVGQPLLALRYLDRAQASAPDDAAVRASELEVRAQALELLGRGDAARASLRRSLEAQPRPPEALLEAARQLLDRGRPELALLYADAAPAGASAELSRQWAELRQRAATAPRAPSVVREGEEASDE
jgi:tetratricopeptide (TPR) repeat protein